MSYPRIDRNDDVCGQSRWDIGRSSILSCNLINVRYLHKMYGLTQLPSSRPPTVALRVDHSGGLLSRPIIEADGIRGLYTIARNLRLPTRLACLFSEQRNASQQRGQLGLGITTSRRSIDATSDANMTLSGAIFSGSKTLRTLLRHCNDGHVRSLAVCCGDSSVALTQGQIQEIVTRI